MSVTQPARLSNLAPVVVLVPVLLAGCGLRGGGEVDGLRDEAPAPVSTHDAAAASPVTGTASVNGLAMYYEIHGSGEPLVLLHGAYSTIEISFGQLIPILARDRQVIAIEQQGHGRTPDLDRPLSYEQMADDTAALLRQLDIERADFFGYSLGGTLALQLALRHPELVRKLAVASTAYDNDGLYPGVLEGIAATSPEDFAGSGLPEAYGAVAPDPDGFPTLVEKVKQLDLSFEGWSPETIASIEAPALIVIGDSDIVSTDHASRLFALLGGGVPGDFTGLPNAQLAVLPGTTHIGVLAERTDWVAPMLGSFLEAPLNASH